METAAGSFASPLARTPVPAFPSDATVKARQLPEFLEQWSVEDVCTWLASDTKGKFAPANYVSAFRNGEITGPVIEVRFASARIVSDFVETV